MPHGFTNRELRTLTAPLLGKRFEDITAGQMTYDLRRLRAHRLVERIPRSRRYRVTDTGLQHGAIHPRPRPPAPNRPRSDLRPSPPQPTALRKAARAYQIAFDDLTHQAGLTA